MLGIHTHFTSRWAIFIINNFSVLFSLDDTNGNSFRLLFLRIEEGISEIYYKIEYVNNLYYYYEGWGLSYGNYYFFGKIDRS